MLQQMHVVLVTAVEALPAHRAPQVKVALALASVADHVVGEREHFAAVPALQAAAGQLPRTVPRGQCGRLEGKAGWGPVRHTQWQAASHCGAKKHQCQQEQESVWGGNDYGAENIGVSKNKSRCGEAMITEQKAPVSARNSVGVLRQ